MTLPPPPAAEPIPTPPPAEPTAPPARDTFAEALAALRAALDALPEHVEIPYMATEEGYRLTKFRKLMEDSPEFLKKIDRARLPNPAAFDAVAGWSGAFPGPVAVGSTDKAKTRAAWSCLGRLWVKQGKPFAWFPARRLVAELARAEEFGQADEFFRRYDFFSVLFVDDLDKINWQFDSQKSALFAFYDWVYRHQKPTITTTNKAREWWAEKMGDAFAGRLFDKAHFQVQF